MMQHEVRNKSIRHHFRTLAVVCVCFALLSCLLFAQRAGIATDNTRTDTGLLASSSLDEMDCTKRAGGSASCLLLWNSAEETSAQDHDTFTAMLEEMRVAYDDVDVSEALVPSEEALGAYRTVVVAMNDLDAMGEDIFALCRWVSSGGRMMFALTMVKTNTFNAIAARLGITGSGDDNRTVHGFRMADGFMIGGDGRDFAVEDAYDAALNVGLDSACTVYATDTQDRTPLIWTRDYGSGRFVCANFGYCGKAYRGIYAAAYSLLEDTCVWPVINASAFYLDDFPSPVPEGDSSYIERDYSMSTAEFYADVWWPDVMSLMKKYQIRYTGVLIETYSDQVSGRLRSNLDTSNFYYYGDMLLNAGGEIGIHGYNHQPLCGPDFVYTDELGYKTWESTREMGYAMQEVSDFAASVFPDASIRVYVPPSNILSQEARQMIGEGGMGSVSVIASTYLPGGDVYEQEFGVSEDGITETPRVISGALFDDYTNLTALSELNLHYVNSHFMHPDDVMDPDRGADLGWEELYGRLSDYLEWLTSSAPSLTMTTGSEMAARVQRFAALSPEVISSDTEEMKLHFTGLVDEGYCLVRCNAASPGEVIGGDITPVSGNLYLLHVTDEDVTVHFTQ